MTDDTGMIGPLRYRLGLECGDLFEEGDEFDGLTLTVECRDDADGQRMIAALREVFGRFSGEFQNADPT